MDGPRAYNEIVADNIVAARARRRLSQKAVAERMQALGFGWRQQIVAAAESGRRRVTVEETLGLAYVLDTTIHALMDPSRDEREVALPSGLPIPVGSVQRSVRDFNDGFIFWMNDRPSPSSTWPWARGEAGPEQISDALMGPILDRLPPSVRAEVVEVLRKHPVLDGQQSAPAVVAAIVISGEGVLIGRRNDGKPPWTFIAGEQEPGEQPADTIIREVKEETTLGIRPWRIIGERDHPATGRHMIYMSARPAGSTEVTVGDEAELAEVRWASLAETEELMPDMFGPVRDYLARELGSGAGS